MSYTLPEPVNGYLADDISAMDVMYRGDPSYEHDGYHMRSAIEKMVRNGYAIYTADEVQAAFDAGRASRDAEVEALEKFRNEVINATGNKALADWIEKHGRPVPMQQEIDSLQAEVEALRADAERYRWLRAGNYPIDFAKSVLNDTPFGIDQAIDAAMAAQEK